MPAVLCIETATHLCSVAVCDGGRVLASRDEEDHERYTHAERLNILVDEAMKEAGLAMRDLRAVAVGIGPGSYTGLRIGLSAAKGFCYALGIPIVGVNTLTTLTSALHASRFTPHADAAFHAMIDARRMEVFKGDPVHALILSEEWIAGLDKSRQQVVFGEGADKAAELWKGHAHVLHVPGVKPHASAMAAMAAERFNTKGFDDLAYLVPLYGKEANVTKAPQ